MQPTYSICVTNYNTVDTIAKSLESILAQVDERFEVVVVDSWSNDGSLEILRKYACMHKGVRLIVKKCSMGLGRQIAIENSRGKYILTQIDMDDVLEPNLKKLLRIYHANFEGCMLVAECAPGRELGIMIAPRELIDAVGGYRDLDSLDDRDLFSRAAQHGYFRFLKSFPITRALSIKKGKHYHRVVSSLRRRYLMFRASFRIEYGKSFCYRVFVKRPVLFLPHLSIAFWAFVTHFPYPHFRNKFIRSFYMDDYVVKIDESFE